MPKKKKYESDTNSSASKERLRLQHILKKSLVSHLCIPKSRLGLEACVSNSTLVTTAASNSLACRNFVKTCHFLIHVHLIDIFFI